MTTEERGMLPAGLLLASQDGAAPPESESGAPRKLDQREYGRLFEPKQAGGRVDGLKSLIGHLCALGEIRINAYRVCSLVNARYQPPLDSEEFDYQFNQMYQRWGAPREEITFADEIQSVQNLDEDLRIEALIHILDGKRLSDVDFSLWRRRLKADYGLTTKEFDRHCRRMPGGSTDGVDPQAPVDVDGERRVAAVTLLNDPGILHWVLLGFKQVGLVGEEANALLLYMAATSRLTEDPN